MSAPRRADVTLRPATPADDAFALAVHASTRERELAMLPFSPEQAEAFVRQQFTAQSAHYAAHYPALETAIVVVGGVDAGRLLLAPVGADELRIVDIALLPAFRRGGVGETVLRGVLDRADAAGLATGVHVGHGNPADRLYARLGFEPVGPQDGADRYLRRVPPGRRR